jgi:hypothetical protein
MDSYMRSRAMYRARSAHGAVPQRDTSRGYAPGDIPFLVVTIHHHTATHGGDFK